MIDLTGQRFSRLLVIGEVARQGKHRVFNCQCDCGTEKAITMNSLRMGRTKSCGCLSLELTNARNTLHGQYGTPAHKSWRSMMDRCHNPSSPGYKNYGGKGIAVCDEWRASFAQFLIDMGPRPDGTSIDRIDNEKGYEPSNCRWGTKRDQRMNQKRGTITMKQAADIWLLREATDWGPNRIGRALGISFPTVSGVIYLNNLKP